MKVGGAVIVTSSNLTIIKSSFEGNSAGVGGAIYAEHSSDIMIANCTFALNTMTCIAEGASCFGGGVLYSIESAMTVCCSIFRNNSVRGNGGVFAFQESTANIYQSIFMNNRAEGRGGVISANSANITISTSEFRSNSADEGGVVHAFI